MIVNPQKWFSKRKVDHIPPHFVKCEATLTDEALLWVTTRLVGRYALSEKSDISLLLVTSEQQISFEDPTEATLFELRWSGSK